MVSQAINPFTERGRITEPARFTGRWRELGMIFERLEARRPVLVTGAPGSGKSSLITHVQQSAGAVLENPDLAAFYLDLSTLPDSASALRLITLALGHRGDGLADLEWALNISGRTVLICLDRADAAVAAGWGVDLLERLARTARRSTAIDPDDDGPRGEGLYDMLLIAAAGTDQPTLYEPFDHVRLGALGAEEVRLLTESYLDESRISFTGSELRDLAALSAGHAAYLQRAAYHLFEAYHRPDYDWREAYLREARETPIPGAPLPPEVFRGEGERARDEGAPVPFSPDGERENPELLGSGRPEGLLIALAPFVAALLAFVVSGSWLLALLVLAAGYLVGWLLTRQR